LTALAGEVSLRRADAGDVPLLATLYAEAAAVLGPQAYTAEQVAAWSSFGADTAAFRDYVLLADTWVAEMSARVVGFCGVDRSGEVRSLYVHPELGRRGLGTRLLAHALAVAESQGTHRFSAWATPFSRPLFERAGFHLDAVHREPYQGVLFDRYRMSRG
jgi:putative acetyltransferase